MIQGCDLFAVLGRSWAYRFAGYSTDLDTTISEYLTLGHHLTDLITELNYFSLEFWIIQKQIWLCQRKLCEALDIP